VRLELFRFFKIEIPFYRTMWYNSRLDKRAVTANRHQT
jgi:hypothetical protein